MSPRDKQERLSDYLLHILQAIERIQRYTGGMTEAKFAEDELTQDAVIRNLEVIGEASNNIQKRFPEFAAAHPELPLAIAYQMRNAVAHGYFSVDLEIVWKTVQGDLATLAEQCESRSWCSRSWNRAPRDRNRVQRRITPARAHQPPPALHGPRL